MTGTDSFIGKTIGGYEILSLIGKGGMATVYCARQTSMNRIVALKVLPRELMRDESYLARFRREVEIVAQLEHRNIVPVYDHGDYDGQPYIAMRYMRAGPVDNLLTNGPLPLERVMTIIGQIAPALDYAHSKNVLHRDLKPSNVLLDDNGDAYLTDFGIARILNVEGQGVTLTTDGVVGTPSYMSPEQAQGQPLDGRSDVYALGVMLFEMATGRRPFHSDTPYSIAVMQVTAPVPSPRSINPNLSLAVEQVIFKAMRKKPEDRYQTAQALAAALKMAVENPGSSIHDTQPNPIHVRQALAKQTQTAQTINPGYAPPAPQPTYPPPVSRTPAASRSVPVAPVRRRGRGAPRKEGGFWSRFTVGALIGCFLLLLALVAAIAAVWFVLQMLTGGVAVSDGVNVVAEGATAFPAGTLTSAVLIAPPPSTARPASAPTARPQPLTGRVLYFAERATDGNPPRFNLYQRILPGGAEMRLTSPAANDLYPSASPDGLLIVYQSDRLGTFDLYTINSVGGDRSPLVEMPVDALYPAWSPDGEWIAFSADTRGDGTYDLYRVRPDGSDLEQLFSNGARNSHPRWDSQSVRLVFTSGAPRDATTWEIMTLDLTTGETRQLTRNTIRDSWAVFSPDDQHVVYVYGSGGTTTIARTRADGSGSPENLHSAGDFIWALGYTPDGAHLVFSASPRDLTDTAVYALPASGNASRIPLGVDDGLHVVWSP